MRRERGLQVFAVTSPTPGDGKTTTAINLAGALAQAPDLRVLLVEADLRRTSNRVAERLGLGGVPGPGLAGGIMNSASSLGDVVRRHPRFALSVVPAGQCPVACYEVVKSPRLGDLLEEARRQYDYVIMDTPPAIAAPDCRVIARWVDGFLIVVAAHQTPLSLRRGSGLRRIAKTGIASALAWTRSDALIATLTRSGRLAVINYHRVVEDGARSADSIPGLVVSRRMLEHQLDWIGRRFR